MENHLNYLEINKKSWNNKTEIHINSSFYDQENFLKGKNSLNSFELELLGDISGKSILHLQCHFGQDTISLSRMGAHVTGVDLSDVAIENARKIAQDVSSSAEFICCDVYSLPEKLDKKFDIVFTSYGTIGWLPDLDKWAEVISSFLKPNGRFVFVEFHPVVWMFDDDFQKVAYNYFNSGPIIENLSGTYADKDAPITQEYIMWNHSMSEVINNLIKHDLKINVLNEYDYSPYACFRHVVEFEPNKFRIEHLGNNIPMVYALSASKIC